MIAKTKNLPVTGLFISIFVAIIMGFVIGALIENLAFKDVHSDVKKLLEEEAEIIKDLNVGISSDIYVKLNARDPLIVGLNIINYDGMILYSDEPPLIGKTFSDKTKISKVVKNKGYYAIDRNLIAQETILKDAYRHLLILFYHFDELGFTAQILYDIRSTEKGVLQITSLLWFTISLSVGTLFVLLVYISQQTQRTLQKAKEDLEIEVKKRTIDLEKLSASLDKKVKERTKALESSNEELVKKSVELQKIRRELESKNVELESAFNNLNKKNKDLIRKTMALTELHGQLQDKNYEMEQAINGMNKQNKDLIRKTMALTELQGQLEDKNYELEKANNEIISLMESRIEFMNRAAHDLRTPITPILLLIPTIKERIKDIGILYDIKVIEKNANYLKRIADNFINYLKSQTGQYTYIFKKTDIKNLIEDVLTTYKEAFNQYRMLVIRKISSNLPLVELDEINITEVLQNLVSNALKFMPKVGKLTIYAEKKDNFINVRFKDTGIGMSKKTLSKIFAEFFKADESRHTPGEGLGLSICKRIIEGHHGRIWAESRGIGKGSAILFDIPINQKVVLDEKGS